MSSNQIIVEISYLSLVQGDYVDKRVEVTVNANSIEEAYDLADNLGYKEYGTNYTGAIKIIESSNTPDNKQQNNNNPIYVLTELPEKGLEIGTIIHYESLEETFEIVEVLNSKEFSYTYIYNDGSFSNHSEMKSYLDDLEFDFSKVKIEAQAT